MTGCLFFLPIAGFLTVMGAYMTGLVAFFGALGTAMGMYLAGMASFFTAFFIIMFG
jgi:hypothetical protein